MKYQFCKFTADGAIRGDSNSSFAPLMSVISVRDFLLNSEMLALCSVSFEFPKDIKIMNSNFEESVKSLVGWGMPNQQLPVPVDEK